MLEQIVILSYTYVQRTYPGEMVVYCTEKLSWTFMYWNGHWKLKINKNGLGPLLHWALLCLKYLVVVWTMNESIHTWFQGPQFIDSDGNSGGKVANFFPEFSLLVGCSTNLDFSRWQFSSAFVTSNKSSIPRLVRWWEIMSYKFSLNDYFDLKPSTIKWL